MFKTIKAIALFAVAAVALIGATTSSAASTKFGAHVTPNVQPSNAGTAHKCPGFEGEKCTWVLNDAYGNAGGEKAPKTGKLKEIRLIAGEAGNFKLQLVKVNKQQKAKVVTQGPRIDYEGQPNGNPSDYLVEKFKLDGIKVHKGEQLAIRTKKTSTLRCSSGGDNTLLYNPALVVGNALQGLGSDDGCWLLVEGVIK